MTKPTTRFIILFVGIFLATFLILYFTGLVPNELAQQTQQNPLDKLSEQALEGIATNVTPVPTNQTPQDTPVRIVATSINLNFQIVNPKSTNYQLLDSSLSEGAVHYPGSGSPGVGNMFIFGHSTGFKTVINKAYQAFNNIKNLKTGDEINIYSSSHIYTYRVTSVNLEKDTQAFVSFAPGKNKLTLSTCNSFGSKEDRYVVEADYVNSSLI